MSFSSINSLVEILFDSSAGKSTGITFITGQDKEEFLSYKELKAQAAFVLYNLRKTGLQAGDELIIQLEDNKSFLLIFWACLIGKIIPVPLSFGGQEEYKHKLFAVWRTLRHPFLITTADQLKRMSEFADDQAGAATYAEMVAACVPLDAITIREQCATELPVISRKDIAYIQYSSGSTGNPKGVILTHENLLYNARDIVMRSGTSAQDKSLSWMPLTHDMGMICFHLSSLFAGIDQYLLPTPLFIRRPSLWLSKASQHGISQLYSPNFGYQYFLAAFSREEATSIGMDLSSIRIIYNGAEPIDAAICRNFQHTLAPYGLPERVCYPGYGLAEASVAVTLPIPGDELTVYYLDRENLSVGNQVRELDPHDKSAVSFVEVGLPIDHCNIRIAGPKDEWLGDDTVGNIQIKGLNVTAGYYMQDDVTRQLYTKDGWLRTGDIGFVRNRRLVITGRAKNMMIVNGQNYYPHDIERVVQTIPGMELGKVVACAIKQADEKNDALVLFILHKGALEPFAELAAAAQKRILEATGLGVESFVPIKKVPKTTSGKVQHFRLIEQFRSGYWDKTLAELKALSAPASAAVGATAEVIAAAWLEVSGQQLTNPQQSMLDASLNSLLIMRFIAIVSEKLSRKLTIKDFFEHPTVAALEAFLEAAPQQEINTCLLPYAAEEAHTVTLTQQRFFMMEMLQPENSPLNISYTLLVEDDISPAVLEAASAELARRHDVLRSFFRLTDAGPRQYFNRDASVSFLYNDLSSASNPLAASQEACKAFSRMPFDLESAPLWRIGLFKVAPGKSMICVVMHHIISDGWTLLLIKNELAAIYRMLLGEQVQLPQTTDFRAYTSWYASWLSGAQYLADKQYWLHEYAGFEQTALFQLPQGMEQHGKDFAASRVSFELDAATYERLQQHCKEQQVSVFAALITLISAWLYKFTGRTDIAIGTDSSGRLAAGLEGIAGCFINTMVIRNRFTADNSLGWLLSYTAGKIFDAFEHQLYPADMKQENAAEAPVMDVLVLFQNFGLTTYDNFGNAKAQLIELPAETSLAALSFEFIEEADTLRCHIDFRTSLFSRSQAAWWPGHFNMLLTALLDTPAARLNSVNMLVTEEKVLLAKRHNDLYYSHIYVENDIIRRFERMTAQTPQATAVLFEGKYISYEELNAQVNQWAYFLKAAHGIGYGDRVGICLPRSDKSLIAILAILKTGASYVPLEQEYPTNRLQFMIADSGLTLLLSDAACEHDFSSSQATQLVWEEIAAQLTDYPTDNPGTIVRDIDEAYVIYTSGTTGRPKGVSVNRLALYDYAQTVVVYFGITDTDIVIQQSALSFDTLLEEIFPALCQGAAIHILRDGGRDIEAILYAIDTGKATILSTTPAVIAELNRYAGVMTGLRVLISGGEMLKYTQIDQLLKEGVNIYNTYGPSETTVCATYHKVVPGTGNIPVGRAIRNRKVYLLDEDKCMVPAGAVGEIYIGGLGVADRYVNQSELTAKSFFEDTVSRFGKMYRTGDLGRWREDGTLEFLGRKDQQVKINGYRIETGEIEAQLAEHPAVGEAVVVARKNGVGKDMLVCYYTVQGNISLSALKAFSKERLPFYMVPAAWAQLDILPLTGNGKVDRKALSALAVDTSDNTQPDVLPGNEWEASLLEGWTNILDTPVSSITANFFEQGGNSLMATRLILWIEKKYALRLTLRDVFSNPTVQEQARLIATLSHQQTGIYEPIPVLTTAPHYPASFSQKRLWLLDNFDENKGAYNLSWAFVIEGPFNYNAFSQALGWLVSRHEALRTNFAFIDGSLTQVIRDGKAFQVDFLDYSNDPEAIEKVRDYVKETAVYPFDLQSASLLKATIIQLNDGVALFVLALHHIIGDAWSMDLISDELSLAYNAFAAGTKPDLPALQIQYKDFAAWQQTKLDGEEINASKQYWLNRFKGDIPVLQLPEDNTRPALQTYNGQTVHINIDSALQQQLNDLTTAHRCGLYVVLLASVKAFLSRISGQTDIVIGAPVSGRLHPDLVSQVGFYVNTLPLRTTFAEDHSFDALIDNVQQTFLDAFEHQDYPLDLLVEELDIVRDESRTPLFNVMVDFLDTKTTVKKPLELDQLILSPFPVDKEASQFDLSFDFTAAEGQLSLYLNFNTDIFREDSIRILLSRYLQQLQNMAFNSAAAINKQTYLPAEEQARVLAFAGKGQAKLPATDLVTLFESKAQQYGHLPAVHCEDFSLSYSALNELSNRLADCLVKEFGVLPGDRVGIMVGRNEWMVVSVLAVLKAGAAYIPMDPEYAAERVNHMIADSGVTVLLTELDELPVTVDNMRILNLAIFESMADQYSELNPVVKPATDDLAYLVYTSGSTGLPKGAMITHRHLLGLWDSLETAYDLNTFEVRLLQVASISFDVFFGDMLRSIFRGGLMVICPAEHRYNLPALYELMHSYRITVMESTPGLLLPLLDYMYEEGARLDFMRIFILGSDTLSVEDYRKIYDRFSHSELRIINSYGTTETTIDSSFYEGLGIDLRSTGYVPVGRPLENTRMYVLDKEMQLCGIGVAGELCIGGLGVGLGYWNRPELTTERFVTDPYVSGGRMYRTGDLARWNAAGNLEFLGRGDNQVKIRGYRIEPGEVESVLLAYSGVQEAVVLAYNVSDREKELVSYIVWQEAADEEGLRSWLREQLPQYMHPAYYITLEAMPLTSNGKVDRKQLPAPTLNVNRAYEGPRNKVEATLVGIWEEVLQKQPISIHDNFFELGGHSLKGMRALWRIRKELGVELSFRDMFSYPRITELSALLNRQTASQGTAYPLVAVAKQASYELSHAQRRLWLLDQLEEQGRSYTMPVQYRVKGTLHTALLEKAFNVLIARHEILRTIFITEEGNPRQQILADAKIVLETADLKGRADKGEALSTYVNRIHQAVFNLSAFPLLQAGLFQVEEEEYVFAFNMHHIISDEWSIEVMVEELVTIYDQLNSGEAIDLPALPVQYKDYSVWQQAQLQGSQLETAAAYWRNQFADSIPVLDLPADHPRPAVKRYEGRTLRMELNKEQLEGLYEVGRRNEASLYMTLLASVKGLLYRYTGQSDIVIGSPVAGRSHELLARQLGFYVNTLALRTQFDANDSFDGLLQSVRDVVLGGFEHQDYPFDLLVEELDVQRDISRSPLFDTMVVLQGRDYQGMTQQTWENGLQWEETSTDAGVSKFDLTLLFREHEEGIQVEVEYNTQLFSAARMERFCAHYDNFVNGIVADSTNAIAEITYLSIEEQHRLLDVFNDTGNDAYPSERTIHSLFEENALHMGSRTAVVYEDRTLTYAALNSAANKVADYLRREHGVESGDLVGLMVERSEKLIICLLGILKAGAAYVPVDPAYPAARISYMLEDSTPRVVLTDSLAAVALSTGNDLGNVPTEGDGTSLAYMIYTSGSTGQPKGAMIAHHAVINLSYWLRELIYIQYPDGLVAMLTASINFDASVQQLFAPLLSGSQLVIISEADRRQIERYVAQLKKNHVAVIDITPGYLRVLMDVLKVTGTDGLQLKYILVGGEALPAEDRALFHEIFGNTVHLINVYGVTEATVDSTYEIVTADDNNGLSIGRPLKNTRMYVLDKNLQLCAYGVTGELCIGGAGVGLGYWNRPELTAERFITDPYLAGGRIYRTGDLARWTSAGNIEYLGRGDNQVKIRGYRIEPGEVENVLGAYSGIREAVVLAYSVSDREKELVSYIVWQEGADEEGLRNWLREKLPQYMHPAYYITLDAMPLTSNGKVDRKQLPAPVLNANCTYEGPRNKVEETLVSIWEEVLQKHPISIHDNFFDLGGHSLKGMRALWRIRQELGVELSFRDMFTYPRITELSALLGSQATSAVTAKPLVAVEEQSSYELSHAQRRLWLLDQLEEQGRSYTMPVEYRVKGALDAGVLEDAFNALIARHEILRTIFITEDGHPRQQVLAEAKIALDYADLKARTDKGEALSAYVTRIHQAVFKLSGFPLLQAGLYKVEEAEYVFVLNMHHIISDEWSAEVMVEELVSIYDQLSNGQSIELPALPVQYKDYSAWQQAQLQGGQLETAGAYWRNQFADGIPVLDLPVDNSRPAVKTYAGQTLRMELNKTQLAGLYETGRRNEASLYMTLLASVKGLLYRYTGQSDIVIGSPVAGRNHELLARQLGFYVNTLALRTQFDGRDSFDRLLQAVRQVVLGGFEHQDYPFDRLVEELDVQRDMSRSPLFDVMLVLQDRDARGVSQQFRSNALQWEEVNMDTAVSKFDLTLIFKEHAAGISIEIEYNTRLFSAERIARFASHYSEFVNEIVADSSIALADISYLSAEELNRVLHTFNHTGSSVYPADRSIHSLFEEKALRMGESIAVVYEDRQLTYAALNSAANKIADYLRREHGVVNGDLVGVMMERSEQLIVCLLGILKAGAAYVPIDPSYPASRISYMLEDSLPRVVLTAALAAAALSNGVDNGNVDTANDANALAYIIYTSGSTGKPKGVMVPHIGVVRLVYAPNYVTFSEEDRLLQTGSVSFDASTFEIWGMLLNGGTLYLLDHDKLMDADILKDTIQQHNITMMWFSAPWFNQLVDNDPSLFEGLKDILVGGDKLSPAHINAVLSLYPDINIINGYGPTENTTFSICYPIREAQTGAIPLGYPVSGTQVYILDKQFRPLPVGSYGELYLAGDGLATGYLNMDDRNRERFVDNPFKPGTRMYSTGDIGRWNNKGEVEFTGRTDDQVKIRGFRIEPGEIADAILEHTAVKDAVVIPFTTAAGEKELAAYVVWTAATATAALQSFLRDRLPSYMQPGCYIDMEVLPLNANGKVDRDGLPAPQLELTAALEAPRNATETALLSIWKTILQREDIGIYDNFFDKGGHSLRASRLLAGIHKELNVKLSLKTLFLHNTIAALSEVIAAADKVSYEALTPVAEQVHYNVSHAQKRLWILDQMESNTSAYNIPGAYNIEGQLDKTILDAALNILLGRHESLRTIFIKSAGEPKQQVLAADKVKAQIAYHDLREDANKEATAEQLLHAAMHNGFALHTWPLFRASLIQLEAERYIFVFCIHHIISDGWSQGVIGKEISAIYNALIAGRTPELSTLSVQYKDYTGWHSRLLEGQFGEEAKHYWSKRFDKPAPWLNMPADRLRPRLQTFDGDVVKCRFGTAVTTRLQQFSREQDATLFMSLLALVNTLLYRYTGIDDIVITSPIAAREHADLNDQIGFFANTLPLRTRFSDEQSFEALLQEVKDTTVAAYRYQMYPYDMVIEDATQQYDPSHAALSDVMLVLQSNESTSLDLQGTVTAALDLSTNTARFDLVFIFTMEEGELCLDLGFNTNIYDRARIVSISQALTVLTNNMLSAPAITVKELAVKDIPADEVSDKDIPMAIMNGHLVYAAEVNAALETLPGIIAANAQVTEENTLDVFITPGGEEGHTIARLLNIALDEHREDKQVYTLPNGLPICYKNKTETDFTYHEVFEQHAYLRNDITIHPGDVIFDVGANIGMFSMYAGHHFPGCRVFAFEPIPPIYNCLAANAAMYNLGITAMNMGLSTEETTAEFVYYPNNTIISGRFGDAIEDKEVVRRYLQNKLDSEGSTMSEKHMEEILEDMIRSEKWECRLSTVSNVMREQGVEWIDLLKVDVEKSEWDILQGIEAADWKRIRQVIVEVHDTDGRLERITRLLEEHGFGVYVEQEEELAGTALYNIYAIHHQHQRAAATPAAVKPGWNDVAAYYTHINGMIHDRLPAYLGNVNVYLTDYTNAIQKRRIDAVKTYNATLKGVPAAQPTSLQLVVAATFTADPLSDYITWWTDRFSIPVQVKLAPYNQVFQELLNDDSLSARNKDINLLLVRWEDWIRDARGTAAEQRQLVTQSLEQLISVLQSAQRQALYMVGVIPPVAAACPDTEMFLFLEQINYRWTAALAGMDHVHTLDLSSIGERFGIAELYDTQRDKLGHIPFQEEVYAAVATMVARQIRAYKQPSFKLIVLDCDNTLWSGVVGEDGVNGIQLLPEHIALQRFMKQKKEEGFLLALSSKNNEADVWEVFEQRTDMVLRKDDFVTWRINWNNKAANIQEIVTELNIGINACCFIDDSPVECTAVTAAHPEVLVLQLPEETSFIPRWLSHIWAFDKFTVTEEDRKRTEMYQAEKERRNILEAQPTIGDFLAQLQLQIIVQDVQEADIPRVAQLTERTNQFNLNGQKKTAHEIEAYMLGGARHCKTIRVTDKFGDYGLTGALITTIQEDSLLVDTFLLSCRVLGRQVEQSMLAVLKEQAQAAGLQKIVCHFTDTGKNKPFAQFLASTSWTAVQTEGKSTFYEILPENIVAVLPVLTSAAPPEPVATTTEESTVLVFDHIGVAVSDLEASLRFYTDSGFTASELVYDPIQNVEIYMCRTASGGGIELIAAHDELSPVNNIISRNGDQPYHWCYRVKDIDTLFDRLTRKGLAFEIVKQPEQAVLFGYKRVVFIDIKQIGLVEFIEDNDSLPGQLLPAEMEISMVTFDIQPALQFFQLVGYRETRHITDHVNKEYVVVLHTAANGPAIRLIMPLPEAVAERAAFLQQNGPHIHRLLLHTDTTEKYPMHLLPPYFTVEEEHKTVLTDVADWEPVLAMEKDATHYALQLPLLYNSGARLLQIPVYQVQKQRMNTGMRPPETTVEKALFRIWVEVLRHEAFGVQTSFLEAGGNSIRATQILSRIYRQYGVELLLTEFFNKPTISALAALIEKKQPEGFESIRVLPAMEHYPLSFSQKQLWISDQFESSSGSAFNIPVAYILEGQLDKTALTKAFSRLVERHEILRTVFVKAGDEAAQQVLPATDDYSTPEWIDLSTTPDAEAAAMKIADEEAQVAFNLETGPLLRIKVLQLSAERNLLLFTTHHIVSDGWSSGIMLREVAVFYNAIRNGRNLVLPALPVQYKDYAAWQQEQMQRPAFAAHRQYWLSQFQDGVPALQLPYDFPRPSFKSYNGNTRSFILDKTQTAKIKTFMEQQEISLFMFFVSVTKLLLYRLSGQQELVVGFPVSGRYHPELEDQVGCYVNTIALRSKLDTQSSLQDFVHEIRQSITHAYTHAAYPFERLVEELGGHTDLSRSPLFDVMVQIQDAHMVHQQDAAALEGLSIHMADQQLAFSKYDLTVNVMETDDGISIDLEYNTDLFKPDTINTIQADCIRLIHILLTESVRTLGETRMLLAAGSGNLMQQYQQAFTASIDESF
ncbi:non-ribosomal peptide synthetase [Chitinophaga pinensis]|uniref:Amino acid adenylation domain protein n=1 Tax=Chitinophaga pinensis (strain ATCC 43595 / DSM 2588 / LMG 13176 / NBRC 15968 / NCIMB 11800 / UQM 2034) TaxID=485918 RepID=A0A979G506_CHIPD|nr:non-ribosomal peptide synthetase [Chitinophaga pinensis]ACU60866.1 amino acid adenylation domain protein [Chitinophaga pinensis DSM 2588]